MESAMSTQQVAAALAAHPDIKLVFVHGSVARGQARSDSGVDVAIQASAPLDAGEKIRLIEDIAAATGRAVALVDLRVVGEPLLGQILKHGLQIRGKPAGRALRTQRHVYAMGDFMPYVECTLAERRKAWIG